MFVKETVAAACSRTQLLSCLLSSSSPYLAVFLFSLTSVFSPLVSNEAQSGLKIAKQRRRNSSHPKQRLGPGTLAWSPEREGTQSGWLCACWWKELGRAGKAIWPNRTLAWRGLTLG